MKKPEIDIKAWHELSTQEKGCCVQSNALTVTDCCGLHTLMDREEYVSQCLMQKLGDLLESDD